MKKGVSGIFALMQGYPIVAYMKDNLFIPKKINVGFQERKDTYTKRLAYIIYYDGKNVLRKQRSWDAWRDHSIPNEEYANVPTEGFVLNKHAGGCKSGWNFRQSYIRVYDPRGFEFEITVKNLLYILENCSAIKGKGLEGSFVYAWNGTELVLLPVDTPDYEEINKYNDKLENGEKITEKTLVCGYTYRKKDNSELMYLGRYETYHWKRKTKEPERRFLFADFSWDSRKYDVVSMNGVNGKFIETVSREVPADFDEILEKLNHNELISPRREELVRRYISLDELAEVNKELPIYKIHLYFEKKSVERQIFAYLKPRTEKFMLDDAYGFVIPDKRIKFRHSKRITDPRYANEKVDVQDTTMTFAELFDKYDVYVLDQYLENGFWYRDGLTNEIIFDTSRDMHSDRMILDV